MKTPVSRLQELLCVRGKTPEYELLEVGGTGHEPTFQIRVMYRDKGTLIAAIGTGRSKKQAKHAAASALIDRCFTEQLESPHKEATVAANGSLSGGSLKNMANFTGSDDASSDSDENVMNLIGWLQEVCVQRSWPPPAYEMETEVGPSNDRLFSIACNVLNYREVGKGKNKKIAKRLAAHKMWVRVQEAPYTPSTKKDLLEKKPCIQTTNTEYKLLLTEIAADKQFEVTYVDIEEKTQCGLFQCLVQLSTSPVGVCHGTGLTLQEAQRHAAQNALEYLKIMPKKEAI